MIATDIQASTSAAGAALDALRARLERIHAACMNNGPKQAVGEMLAAMLKMPEWQAAAQPSGDALEAPVLGWRHVKDGLPQPGQDIMGKAEKGGTAWTEKWDETEPIGRMTWWRPAPTLRLPEKFDPSASHVHPERRDGYNQAIDDCHLVLGLDLPHNGRKQ